MSAFCRINSIARGKESQGKQSAREERQRKYFLFLSLSVALSLYVPPISLLGEGDSLSA